MSNPIPNFTATTKLDEFGRDITDFTGEGFAFKTVNFAWNTAYGTFGPLSMEDIRAIVDCYVKI